MAKKSVKNKSSDKSDSRVPTQKQIEEGLYFDFEGFGNNEFRKNLPPVLCGYRFGGYGPVSFAVFNEKFRWAAESDEIGQIEFIGGGEKMKQFLIDLIDRRTRGGKKIFYYSSHEKDEFDRRLGIQIRKRLRDVRKIMKKSIPSLKHGERTLINYCSEVGIPVPTNYGKGKVTQKFRKVRDYSATKSAWGKAPSNIKRQWNLILEHNRFDVESMYELLQKTINNG
ncbi:hypothetical protein OAK16_04650 [Verrucomicrobia bacterium]|nr:hypothetical protein [Verrucomicrobiota bacterium]